MTKQGLISSLLTNADILALAAKHSFDSLNVNAKARIIRHRLLSAHATQMIAAGVTMKDITAFAKKI